MITTLIIYGDIELLPYNQGSVERKDIMNMVATMCAGIFSNPASGDVARDSYMRQQTIQQLTRDVQTAVQDAGLSIIEPGEKA